MSFVHDEVDIQTGKPKMNLDYNATKSGEMLLISCAPIASNARRCPKIISFTLLNIAGTNSEVIYISNDGSGNTPATLKKAKIFKTLAKEVCLRQRTTSEKKHPNSWYAHYSSDYVHPNPLQNNIRRCLYAMMDRGRNVQNGET